MLSNGRVLWQMAIYLPIMFLTHRLPTWFQKQKQQLNWVLRIFLIAAIFSMLQVLQLEVYIMSYLPLMDYWINKTVGFSRLMGLIFDPSINVWGIFYWPYLFWHCSNLQQHRSPNRRKLLNRSGWDILTRAGPVINGGSGWMFTWGPRMILWTVFLQQFFVRVSPITWRQYKIDAGLCLCQSFSGR